MERLALAGDSTLLLKSEILMPRTVIALPIVTADGWLSVLRSI